MGLLGTIRKVCALLGAMGSQLCTEAFPSYESLFKSLSDCGPVSRHQASCLYTLSSLNT